MKNRKLLNRTLSLLLIVFLLFSLSLPASASTSDAGESSISSSASPTSSPQPRGFVKTRTIYLEKNVFYDFFDDPNLWGDRNVTVTFKSTEGPTSIWISVWDNGEDSNSNLSRTLSVGEATSFRINPQSFRIMATNNAGPNGNVTVVITLT